MWFLIDESLLGWMDRCYKNNMCVCNKRKSKSSLSLSLLAFKHCNHHQIYVAIDVILISSIHLKPFRILKWTWWVKNSRKKRNISYPLTQRILLLTRIRRKLKCCFGRRHHHQFHYLSSNLEFLLGWFFNVLIWMFEKKEIKNKNKNDNRPTNQPINNLQTIRIMVYHFENEWAGKIFLFLISILFFSCPCFWSIIFMLPKDVK